MLTNGRTFHFHTDLESPNKLDDRPFLTFDLSDMHPQTVGEISKFTKAAFNVEAILLSAHRLKYTSAIKKEIAALMEAPNEDFVRMVVAPVQTGRFTAQAREQLTPLVKNAFREIIRDAVQARLSTALADTVASDVGAVPIVDEDEIVTTDEEREGFMIVRAIVRDTLKGNRVVMRDQKSYCGVLVDNNNRKPLARMHFNRPSNKQLGLFDGEKEERVKIDSLDQIYDFTDRLRKTAKFYADGGARKIESASSESASTEA